MRAERAAADQVAREQQQREAAARLREERERQQLVAAAQERDRQQAQAQTQAARDQQRDRQRDEPARRPEPPPSALPAAPTLALAQPVGAVAALRDLYEQRDRRHVVDARASSGRLKIGRDALELTVTSSLGGYLYVVLLGSDETSFYMLFPNGLDRDNRIAAGVPTRLPRPNWQVQASGPAGTDNLLVIVSNAPRDLSRLSLAPTGASAPFTYTAADVVGRSKLIAFMLGESPRNDGVPRFGARWLTIEETP